MLKTFKEQRMDIDYMILVFDTETTNLPQPKLPLTHPAQARICQLACILLDELFNEVGCFYSLIKPNGWIMQPGAQAAHGITQEKCEKQGISIDDAMIMLFTFNRIATKGRVAHNIKFDTELFNIELNIKNGKSNMSPQFLDSGANIFCTMLAMTPVCKLPGRGNGNYKWPKLSEAAKHIGVELNGAHDALNDVRATAKIFHWLVENKHVTIANQQVA